MAFTTEVAAIARDATWLPHRYDPGFDTIHFLKLSREDHRAAAFLIDEELPADADRLILGRADSVEAAAANQAPLHVIFHSAYCCSTLLARALDIEGVSKGLREPVILNDIVGWRRRGAERSAVARVLDGAATLLAQPFGKAEAIVVKPSNIVNGLATVLLSMRPDTNALLLYAPLQTYLGSIAKKGMWGRLWVRELFAGLLKDGLIDLGFEDEQLLRLTDLQVAAAGWLAQQALFAKIAAHFGPGRVLTLDSETFTARPADTLAALSRHFRLTLDTAAIARVVTGPAFSRHSKFDRDFGSGGREAEHREAAGIHGDEIEKVMRWAEAVAANAGTALTLSSPLLG